MQILVEAVYIALRVTFNFVVLNKQINTGSKGVSEVFKNQSSVFKHLKIYFALICNGTRHSGQDTLEQSKTVIKQSQRKLYR